LKHIVWDQQEKYDEKTNRRYHPTKLMEIPFVSLARYFYTLFDKESNIESVQFAIEGTKENLYNAAASLVEVEKAKMIYWFKDGTQASPNTLLSAVVF
jgi:hypothetical protein